MALKLLLTLRMEKSFLIKTFCLLIFFTAIHTAIHLSATELSSSQDSTTKGTTKGATSGLMGFTAEIELEPHPDIMTSELGEVWEIERINQSEPCNLVPGSFCRSDAEDNWY